MSDELLKIFLGDAEEQLEVMSRMLLTLEENHDDKESLDEIFRAAHSLKGASATLGYSNIASLTHDMETLLDTFRRKEKEVTRESVDVILKCFDTLTAMIEMVADGKDDDMDISAHINAIAELLNETSGAGAEVSANDAGQFEAGVQGWVITEYDRLVLNDALIEHKTIYEVEAVISDEEGMKDIRCMVIANQLRELGELIATIPNLDDDVATSRATCFRYLIVTTESEGAIYDAIGKTDIVSLEIKIVDGAALTASNKAVDETPQEVEAPQEKVSSASSTPKAAKKEPQKEADNNKQAAAAKGLSSIRVDTDRLDSIMNLVGELVINRTMFVQLKNTLAVMEKELDELGVNVKNFKALKTLQADFDSIHQRMGRISTELQERVMQIRLLPISIVFTRFTRLVRDLAASTGKDINLMISGETTEIDKTVIEVIGDPLIHIVRNAVSHGIETPEERLAAGKDPKGTIKLDARHEGNHVVVEVVDDGRGLDKDKILQKAIDKKIITAEQAATLTDREVYEFIFKPDFSTAAVVDDVSGRGVGLDVVAKNIEKLNGNIDIKTQPGKGSRFTLRFPLTLAIIQALLAKVSGETFCIPLGSILETVRITTENIKTIEGREVMMLRGNVISLLRMNEVLDIGEPQHEKHMFVVVVGVGERRVGLIVDKLVGRQEIVIKTIDDEFVSSPEIAGATVLGNGTISLIFDITALVEMGMDYMNEKLDNRKYN